MFKTIKNRLIFAVFVLIFLLQISSSVVQVYQVQSKLIEDLESDALNMTTPFLLEIEATMNEMTKESEFNDEFNFLSFNGPDELIETYTLVYGSRDFPPLLEVQESLRVIQFVSDEGKIIYHPDKRLINRQAKSKLISLINKQKLLSTESEQRIHIVVPFYYNQKFEGSIVLSYSTEKLEKEKWQVIKSALFLFIIYLFVGVIGAWGISRTITNPINKLNQVFEIVASGSFDQKVNTSREDELGNLAQNFAYLQSSIKEKVQFIENYNRTLEEKILERTENILNQKGDELKAMYHNIKQGIFTITKGNIIEEQYSDYLKTLLESNDIAGTNALETIFGKCDLDAETLQYINIGLSSIITNTMQSYGSHRHLLINELEKQLKDGSRLRLEIDWHPITNDQGTIEKVMVTFRDVTSIRQLQKEVKAHKYESAQIKKSLESTKGKIEMYGKANEHFSPDIITVSMLMPKIIYISSWNRGKASEIFIEDSETSIKILLSLQKIEETLFDKLTRPHFSYLINPTKSWRITRRSSSDYNLEYQNHKVPISRTNFHTIKKMFAKT